MFNFSKIFFLSILILALCLSNSYSETVNTDFNIWLEKFKISSQKRGISKETIYIAFKNVKFIDKVIVYDRRQPEFYEDTITYVSKRANQSRLKNAKKLYRENKELFLDVEKNFLVEKEILLSLWGM